MSTRHCCCAGCCSWLIMSGGEESRGRPMTTVQGENKAAVLWPGSDAVLRPAAADSAVKTAVKEQLTRADNKLAEADCQKSPSRFARCVSAVYCCLTMLFICLSFLSCVKLITSNTKI